MPEIPDPPDKEFNELKSDPELTQEKLQKRLNDYAAAIRSEYESQTSLAPENVEEYTRDFFKRNIHMAAAQIVWLSGNAEKESVRLSACKTVVDLALAEGKEQGDPIKELLNQLTSKKKTAEPA